MFLFVAVVSAKEKRSALITQQQQVIKSPRIYSVKLFGPYCFSWLVVSSSVSGGEPIHSDLSPPFLILCRLKTFSWERLLKGKEGLMHSEMGVVPTHIRLYAEGQTASIVLNFFNMLYMLY